MITPDRILAVISTLEIIFWFPLDQNHSKKILKSELSLVRAWYEIDVFVAVKTLQLAQLPATPAFKNRTQTIGCFQKKIVTTFHKKTDRVHFWQIGVSGHFVSMSMGQVVVGDTSPP